MVVKLLQNWIYAKFVLQVDIFEDQDVLVLFAQICRDLRTELSVCGNRVLKVNLQVRHHGDLGFKLCVFALVPESERAFVAGRVVFGNTEAGLFAHFRLLDWFGW